MKKRYIIAGIIIFLILFLLIIKNNDNTSLIIERESKIPLDAVKMTPETDDHPPILHSSEYKNSVPLDSINSAGAEDSPFIPLDRNEIYFFFTPDVRVPVEKQILDEVTGIWFSKYEEGVWQKPERVVLQDKGKLAGDGCEFVKGDFMLFCSVREGYTGINWFSSDWDAKKQKWTDWKNADFNPEYEVGELHIYKDELYYHSSRAGGKGNLDIWMLKNINSKWENPVNIEIVNSPESEGWPYITPDGKELWFTRFYQGSPAVFRSKRINGNWQEPELIISQFAGEPTLDSNGNIYFVHHFYKDSKMIEADIYVAYKK